MSDIPSPDTARLVNQMEQITWYNGAGAAGEPRVTPTQPPLWCAAPEWTLLAGPHDMTVCATMGTVKKLQMIAFWSCIIMHAVLSMDIQHEFEKHTEVSIAADTRGRRDVIEEEKFFNINSEIRRESNMNHPTPWMPGPLPPEEDPTTKISLTNPEVKEVLPLYQTTEGVTDKPTGRGARASNENWIKLPFPDRDNHRDDILTPPQPSGDLINSRMPRVNFVTQNKQLEASESRNDKQSIQRATRTDDIRTEFVRPGEEKPYKPVYPRQAVYYPEESRRQYYDDRYYPVDDMYRRDPYFDLYDRRRYPVYPGPRIDRYDETFDNYVPRKPKRIIYYAHLPEVMRTPPNVDLRHRFGVDPYRRFDDDYYARNGRYDYRFRNRYPYAPLRKEERNYRDLAGSGTVVKDKKTDDKVTPTPVLPQKEDKVKNNNANNNNNNRNVNVNRNFINSHQYHDGLDSYTDQLSHKAFQDVLRPDDGYLRFEEPLFQGAIEDPYQRKY